MTAGVLGSRPDARVLLHGEDGLRQFRDYGTSRVTSAKPFHVEMTRRGAPGVELQIIAASEHEGVRGPAEIAAAPLDLVSVTLVVSGTLRTWDSDDDGITDLGPGSLSLRLASEPHGWRFDCPTTIIRSSVPASSLPDPLLLSSRLPRGPLPRTRLVVSYISLLQTLACGSTSFTMIEAEYLWRALANLEVALIAEAIGEVGPEPHASRTRIADYIDGHLSDPALGPEAIALALGVSVRSVHRVFNHGDVSVNRYIRDQRLRRVEAALRNELRISRTSVLSRRFGFTGPDQLSRAFRARFGMTIHDYVEALPIRVREG